MTKSIRWVFLVGVLSVGLAMLSCTREEVEAPNVTMQQDLDQPATAEQEFPEVSTYPVPMPIEVPSLAMPDAPQPSAVLSDLDEQEGPAQVTETTGEARPGPLPEEPPGGESMGSM